MQKNKWAVIGLRLHLSLIAMLAASTALAQGDPSDLVTRPGNGEPTPVSISLHLFDIVAIDDVRQRFQVDLFILATWQDERLALPENQRNGSIRSFPHRQVWSPRAIVVNDRGLRLQLPERVDVDDLGNVVYKQRVTGELAANLEFDEFPFDIQYLLIDFISYEYDLGDLEWRLESFTTDEQFSADGWEFELLEPQVGGYSIPAVDVSKPRLTINIRAVRNGQYYLLTMFLPMSLIIFMSWTAFWIKPDVVNPRIAISTASIFSLIALGFSIRLGLPRLPYLTRADTFVLGCTLLVFLALAVAVIGSRWAGDDKLDRAISLNAFVRWAYVILFCIITFAAFQL